MNERGVEVLMDAAMRGVPQVYSKLEDGRDGRCAIGVMLEALFGTAAWGTHTADEFNEAYGTTSNEIDKIVSLNNTERLDFIGIARKLGVNPEGKEGSISSS